MKKIITASLITSLLLISCVSNNSEKNPETQIESQDIQDQIQVPENSTLDEETQSEETDFSAPEQNADSLVPSEPETEIITEDDIQDAFIPQEELISQEDLLEDFTNLAETTEEESQIDSESDEASVQIASEPEAVSIPESVKTEPVTVKQQEPKAKKEETVKQEPVKKENDETKPAEAVQTSSFLLQEELSAASDAINETEAAKPPVPSRTVSINNNQYLDINYPGTGWIYLGEVERKNLLVFYGRKITDGNTTFTLQSRKSGTAVLHFYKNDALSGKYIDDYVEVTVDANSATDNTHIVSPEYASIVPPKPQKPLPPVTETEEQHTEDVQPVITRTPATSQEQKQKSSDPELNIQTIIQNAGEKESKPSEEVLPKTEITDRTSSTSSEVTVELTGDLLEKARKELNDKHYENAFALIKAYLASASDKIDEALFIEAQILEAASPVQNIKEAIKDYDTIIKNWPASRYWKKSNERSIYLKRFYIDIR